MAFQSICRKMFLCYWLRISNGASNACVYTKATVQAMPLFPQTRKITRTSVAELTANFLTSVFASVSLLVVIIMLLFKIKKNLLPTMLMLVGAVACICELAVKLANPFLPSIVFQNSIWTVSRIVVNTMLFVELAVLLCPNHSQDIK